MTSRHPAVSCACPKCQSERRTTPPPPPAAEEREAVARAMYECDPLRVAGPPSWDKDSDEIERGIYLRDADAALSALAPVRAAEILAAEANERARIVASLRATSTGLDLTNRRIADAIERGEHGAGK